MHAVVKMPVDTLHPVAPEDVPYIWPEISHYLDDANAYGGGKFLMIDWLTKLLLGHADLLVYPGSKSAAICEPIQFPRRRVYAVNLCGGEGGIDWLQYQAACEAGARVRGCDCIEIFGRPGWKNILEKQLGYKRAHWVWRKEI